MGVEWGINLNGEPGEFFRTIKGIETRGPFVPFFVQLGRYLAHFADQSLASLRGWCLTW
jgi:hypothetical protein